MAAGQPSVLGLVRCQSEALYFPMHRRATDFESRRRCRDISLREGKASASTPRVACFSVAGLAKMCPSTGTITCCSGKVKGDNIARMELLGKSKKAGKCSRPMVPF
jgi:hypothetical protein